MPDRGNRKVFKTLIGVLVVAVLGVLQGATGWEIPVDTYWCIMAITGTGLGANALEHFGDALGRANGHVSAPANDSDLRERMD